MINSGSMINYLTKINTLRTTDAAARTAITQMRIWLVVGFVIVVSRWLIVVGCLGSLVGSLVVMFGAGVVQGGWLFLWLGRRWGFGRPICGVRLWLRVGSCRWCWFGLPLIVRCVLGL